ncbi:MAG: cytidylate kinase-like family protein [Bacteroidales bacterium]|nr:cytidylate kinase-like family protein [Bacteroidales bacterium]
MTNQNFNNERPWKNIFEKYLKDSLNEKKKIVSDPGPYVSISREFGCMANNIAKKLSKQLSEKNTKSGKKQEWKWINKEILEESANALELTPSKIKYVFMSEQKSMMDEIISSMSYKYYKSDKMIRKTIIDVIRSILSEGNIIIVERGGVAFAKDIPKSFHIKLQAPVEWRVKKISKNYNKSLIEAKKYAIEVDNERKKLIDNFFGKNTDNSIFDVIFNCKTMTENEIVEAIVKMMQMKKII